MLTLAVAGLLAIATPAFADTACGALNPCENGNPENVVNVWGTTNSQLPHIQRGQPGCPWFYPTYCVDISHTAWYMARFSR